MAIINLSQGYAALIDDEDLELVLRHKWHAARSARHSRVYAKRCYKEGGAIKNQYLHHYLVGVRAGLVVDHANGDPLDNRRSNLRHCTHHENMMNYKPRPGKTGVPNVILTSWGRYRVKISVNSKYKSFGCYETLDEAREVAEKVKQDVRGRFAHRAVLGLTAKGQLT